MLFSGDITKVHGIRVGQAESESGRTGVTVVLCKKDGAVGGCSVRGHQRGSPCVVRNLRLPRSKGC